MTQDEQMDRLERLAQLSYEAALRDSRATRREVATIRRYWAASDDLEAAKFAASREPQDLKMFEDLRQAKAVFDRAREEFHRLASDRASRRKRP